MKSRRGLANRWCRPVGGRLALWGLVVGLVLCWCSAVTRAEPDAGELGAAWTATYLAPPRYPGVHIDWDVPITMSDGTVLKANVYRPADVAGRPIDTPTPTIVNLTPYTKLVSNILDSALAIPWLGEAILDLFRRFDLTGTPLAGITDITKAFGTGLPRTLAVDRNLIESGYTQIVVDVRGTGFSEGTVQFFGQREQRDTVEVIDWASRQPWSNGSIGMSGVSYSAVNQIQAADKQPPALKAIFPVEPGSDLMHDILAPGGGLNAGFVPGWLAAVDGLKLVPDLVSIAQGRFDWKWLADRAASPLTFFDLLIGALFTPDVGHLPDSVKSAFDENSPLRQGMVAHPDRIRVPTFVVGGWHDVFTNTEPLIYQQIPLPPGRKQLLMGNAYHINPGADFGTPGYPPRLDVLQRAWFDKWLKGIDNGIDTYGPITSQQIGGLWTTTDRYPRAGVDYRRMYLSAAPSGTTGTSVHDGSLTPTDTFAPGRLTVAPGVTSLCSNDTATGTAGGGAIVAGCAADARPQELDGLTFTSAPVAAPTLISGPINVHLNTVYDATDGYWSATLNDVAPDGRSTVLSTGQLVVSLRAIDPARSTRSADGDLIDPYTKLTLDSRQPVVPGQPTTVDLGLTPTDAVLQPGHRLRADVYASNFPKGLPVLLFPFLADTRLQPQHLDLDSAAPSFVNVPIGGAPGW
ncbi:CocE/NonD family hydrolase [Nocardia terpenica]|uniref:CocE/NonD family hydrolase n=1 Tax=Nocardia terpenica TaxID=455432 RepID=UPI0018945A2A|nr:CocE/NonD family hydrolase [Nocardia terpenica]MBF6061507.1 CocE/NonD family hydrolase [Nocardia terpenica]MBF6105264.1 CocE/NonD family hydrolase [Nocardia terpenica]MBF6113266.1 CocE/NonD family hydrolase [Nocardia terpenica]MBF6119396.1 CocE/NonD family hydrolase [Nocardia terpenica]MBF6153044.1 CocE/NonD family hydrolase [Nocardia terpenica]